MLSVVPVGIGAAFGSADGAQSCYLVRSGTDTLVLDMGSGALRALEAHAAPERLSAVAVSHLHPDHCVDLLALRIHMAYGPGRGRRLPVHGPAGLRAAMIGFAGAERWDDAFAHHDLDPAGGGFAVGGLSVTYRAVPHLDPTFAFRVDAGGRSVVYSADCAPSTALVELATGADLLVAECTFGADPVPGGVPHLGAIDAAEIAAAAGVGRLLLTHGQPGHDRARAVAVASTAYAGPVAWASEGVAVAV